MENKLNVKYYILALYAVHILTKFWKNQEIVNY